MRLFIEAPCNKLASIYVILVFIISAISSFAQDIDTAKIYGTWDWVGGFGGQGGPNTPQMGGFTSTLEFTKDGIEKQYKNGVPERNGRFAFKIDTFPGWKLVLLLENFGDATDSFQLRVCNPTINVCNDDTLCIGAHCSDFPTKLYLRRELFLDKAKRDSLAKIKEARDYQKRLEWYEHLEASRILSHSEIMPSYKGGSEALSDFLNSKLKAKCELSYSYFYLVINKDSSISDVKCLRWSGGKCDYEILELLKQTAGSWSIGSQNDRPVNVSETISVSYSKDGKVEVHIE